MLAIAMRLEGYEVQTADDGETGLKAIATHQPDLIVTDVMMPRIDGFEMIRRVRANPQTRFIPVIIQSAARHEADDIRLGAEVGALGYLTAPTDPTDLERLRLIAKTLLEFKNYLDSCEEAAFTDPLTGLANRRRFERQLEKEVARSTRYGHQFCLLMLDVDRFKDVNDAHGHLSGDDALRVVSTCIQSGTRGIDTGARIGGDEFAVILPETDFERGLEVAERLRAALHAVNIPKVGNVTLSIGVAAFPACASNGLELKTASDTALYEAKRAGRDRVARAPSLTSELNTVAAQGVP